MPSSLAGRHPLAEEFAVRDIYRRLGECFSETRRALNRMADEMSFSRRSISDRRPAAAREASSLLVGTHQP
jgi:hypothetical protein